MIPIKIQSLFDFIAFLDLNKKEYIDNYIPICNELKNLDDQKRLLNPYKNYNDKQQYDNIQDQIKEKFLPISLNVHEPILSKLRELEIWSGDNAYSSIWNNNITSISDFNRNFASEDVEVVMYYKQIYFGFRYETNSDFLALSFVFQELDEILKVLFDFFKDSDDNEFEGFETQTMNANNLTEAVGHLIKNRGENSRIFIPNDIFYANLEVVKKEIILEDKIEIGDIHNTVYNKTMGEVFISYSWDSEEHNEKVLSFVNHLRNPNGFDANVDRALSQEETAINFIRMMHKAMLEHPKVIVVLSKGYKTKAESFVGGVGEEYELMLNDIKNNPTKYIFVSFDGRPDEIIPFGIMGRDIIDLSQPKEEERLLRKLTGEKEIELVRVAEKKPVFGQKEIAKFEPVPQNVIEKKCPLEIVKMNVKIGNQQLFASLYRKVDFEISFDLKNVSENSVDEFSFELRADKHLFPENYNMHVEDNHVVVTETLKEPIFPGQTKKTKSFNLVIRNDNFGYVVDSKIMIKVFTKDGYTEKEYVVRDNFKIRPRGEQYGEPVPLDRNLFAPL